LANDFGWTDAPHHHSAQFNSTFHRVSEFWDEILEQAALRE
jgi:hypothetical protein